jgi:hypothetical protein
MDIIKKLEEFNIPEVNDLLDELFETDEIEVRMDIIDDILMELDLNKIDYEDFEDEIKDLAIS